MLDGITSSPLATELFLPLLRLVGVMAVGLVAAQALEHFGWTASIARLVAPMARFGRLSSVSGVAFSLSFASPAAANAMLAEGVAEKKLGTKELVLSNILNSAPAFFVHLPSMLAMAYSFIGRYAFVYAGLVFAAAAARTWGAVLAGRALLPPPAVVPPTPAPAAPSPSRSLRILFARFQKRLTKICLFTIPIYCLIFFLQRAGAFAAVEGVLANHLGNLSFLHPATLGIVALFVAAQSNAAFAAAAALLHGGGVSPEQAVAALLAGNILSSPMRAFRHQLPSYAGFFAPRAALLLVGINQTLRAVTLVLALAAYWWWVK